MSRNQYCCGFEFFVSWTRAKWVCKGGCPIWLSDYYTRSGEYDDDIDFTYDTNTETYKSCSAILNNEMYVFGGATYKRQVNFLKRESLLNNIIDKQGNQLCVTECRLIGFWLSTRSLQYIFIRNHALFFLRNNYS